MSKTDTIAAVRQLAKEGDLEKGFELLSAYLAKQPARRDLYQDVLQAQAQHGKAQRDAQLGVVSAEQAGLAFNRSAQRLLALTERLEQEPSPTSTESRSLIWIGLAVVVVIAGLIFWLVSRNGGVPSPEEPALIVDENCPSYDVASKFNILLLPFVSFDNNGNKPHLAIRSRLARLRDQYGISCDIKTYDIDEADPNAFPSTVSEAERIASGCMAQLIVWGTTEEVAEQTIVRTRYKFINDGDLPLHKLLLTEDSSIDTVSSLSSVATSGLLTTAIEESIKLLFGLIAHQSGQPELAIKILEDLETEDTTTNFVADLVLADNLLALQRNEEALAAYDRVIQQHPDYFLARNNRALLQYKAGDYLGAAEDLSVAIAQDSTDTRLLETRGTAYLRAEQLKEAKEDLKRVKQMGGESPSVKQKIKEAEEKTEAEEQLKQSADSMLQKSPGNVTALLQKASASRKLGKYEESLEAAEEVLDQDTRNPDAFANIIQIHRVKKDTQMISNTVQRASKSDVDMQKIRGMIPARGDLLRRKLIVRPLE